MKLVVLQENLNRALSIASRFIPSHSPLPILEHFLLTTKENRLKISATNSEMGINYYCGAKVKEDGTTAVLARPFNEFVASLPAGKVNLELEKENLKVSLGSFEAHFSTVPHADFPQIDILSSSKTNFPLSSFLAALKMVVFAASSDETRPVLEGVRFLINQKMLLLEATDGYRLSQKRIPLKKSLGNKEFIIPARTLEEILRLKLEGEKLSLGFSLKDKQVVFLLPEMEVFSRLLEGSFPNVQQVIPQKKETTVLVNKEEFLEAIRIASIFARESANIVRLSFAQQQITITANSPQIGENKTRLEAKIEGKEQKIAFNFRFLIDFLQTIESKEIMIELNDSLSPAVFKVPKDESFLHLIMPVRLQEEE